MEKQAPRPKKVPFHKLIPNMITLTAMAFGMSSVKFAIAASLGKPDAAQKWELAALCIVAAAFMDAFDGAAARLLKAQSKLGAELDSFSDFVCFGVAPALVMYLWSLQGIGRWGWTFALLFAMAVALRLARFNIAGDEKDPHDPLSKYFTGVPSPLGAGLAILPLILSFQIDHPATGIDATAASLLAKPDLIGLWMLIVAGMMVSHIPTFSTKQIKIPYKMRIVMLVVFCILIASLLNETWPTLTLLAAVYLISLPFGMRHYSRKMAALSAGEKDPDDQDSDD
ncbi:MAG: phosphatidylcholine/phosphatidylserine synthase [Alphaproteobacteria bacterium]|nr:MAG: phosphatidylcholine/phosphatidylserine synthase [Alphaproteobacteria bacterium]